MRDRLIELLKNLPCESKTLPIAIDESKKIMMELLAEELADYLLENGVIVPPCKVGQTVYRATKLVNGDEFVKEGIIFEVSSTYENGTTKTRFYFWAKGDEWTSRHYSLWCDLTEFGKTVFHTKEEAETKLKEGVQG